MSFKINSEALRRCIDQYRTVLLTERTDPNNGELEHIRIEEYRFPKSLIIDGGAEAPIKNDVEELILDINCFLKENELPQIDPVILNVVSRWILQNYKEIKK